LVVKVEERIVLDSTLLHLDALTDRERAQDSADLGDERRGETSLKRSIIKEHHGEKMEQKYGKLGEGVDNVVLGGRVRRDELRDANQQVENLWNKYETLSKCNQDGIWRSYLIGGRGDVLISGRRGDQQLTILAHAPNRHCNTINKKPKQI